MANATAWYEYHLPTSQIAQTPLENRDSARLLVDECFLDEPQTEESSTTKDNITKDNINMAEMHIYDLPDLINPNDLLVVNNTRVQKARLHLQKETGGKVEVLALSPHTSKGWTALLKPSKRVPPNTTLYFEANPVLHIGNHVEGHPGERAIKPAGIFSDIPSLLEELGQIPLPPYIHTPLADPERYQTIYSKKIHAKTIHQNSTAAPTAGLHLTPELLQKISTKAEILELELIIGLATFSPIEADDISEHQIHSESYFIPEGALEKCRQTKAAGGRVIAVGTTVVRALESAAITNQMSGETQLFIQPGFDFQIVDGLLTNFHMPRSTLLVLLAAFIGERWKAIYDFALGRKYRFLSFGDAMLIRSNVN